jgi:hypothetical protein
MTTTQDELSASGSGATTPIGPIFAVSALNSISTTVLTSAIYFLTAQAYSFSSAQNYLLGFVMGVSYIAGSLAAGPFLRWTRARARPIQDRTILTWVITALGATCIIPWLFRDCEGSWPIWLQTALYSPISGLLWPIVESYLSGGRTGENLRSALGKWNVLWSGAGALGLFVISPLIKDHALEGILLFGGAHFLSLIFLPRFTPMTGRHGEDATAQHPAVFRDLLVAFRIMLPVAYVVVNTLIPYLPAAMTKIGVEHGWQTVLFATYQFSRSATFLFLHLRTSWHGRWSLAIAGPALIVTGFGTVIGSGWLHGFAGLSVLIAGLMMLGTGMAAVYVGAIYYAMEVGHDRVDAGGAHEALIGIGYAGGPAFGLAATYAASSGWTGSIGADNLLLIGVGVLSAGTATVVFRRVHKHLNSP